VQTIEKATVDTMALVVGLDVESKRTLVIHEAELFGFPTFKFTAICVKKNYVGWAVFFAYHYQQFRWAKKQQFPPKQKVW